MSGYGVLLVLQLCALVAQGLFWWLCERARRDARHYAWRAGQAVLSVQQREARMQRARPGFREVRPGVRDVGGWLVPDPPK